MAEMFPNAGGMGGMPGGGGAPEKEDDGSMVNLNEKIDKTDSYARGESPGFPMSNLFIGDSRLGCKSDTDEQLILHIAFQEFVKVSEVLVVQSCLEMKGSNCEGLLRHSYVVCVRSIPTYSD
jgi:hypothetical protein